MFRPAKATHDSSTALFAQHADHSLLTYTCSQAGELRLHGHAVAMHTPRVDLKGCTEGSVLHMVELTTLHHQSLKSVCATRCCHMAYM